MSRRVLLVVGVVLAVAGLALAAIAARQAVRDRRASATAPTSQTGADPVVYAAALRAAVDDERAAAGLPRLDDAACALPVATARADDLVGKPLQHAPLTDALAVCAPLATAAENLSRAQAGAGDVVAAWLGSPGHRANLLDPELSATAVACVHDGEAMLCSQVFVGP